jgi:ribosomal protein S6--L-glutamate ligase
VRLIVLSRSAKLHTTRRLVEAARALGHEPRVIDPLEVELGLGGAAPELYWRRRRFPAAEVVIPRIGPSIHQYGLSVLKQLELKGVPLLNGSAALAASRNKMRCLQLLASAGVPVPRTVMASDPSGLAELVKLVGGVPVLVKLLSADGKSGVMVCESLQSLEAALEAILGLGQNIVVQQYLEGGRGRELRALVVGGQVVAALRRQRRPGKGTAPQKGARFRAAELSPEQARLAVEAARVLGLQACAVDMLDVRGGPRVFEVNGSPSLRDVEAACGVDVARLVVERAVAMAGKG